MRLIELDAAIKATWKDTGYTDPLNVMTAIRDRIEALPTVDAVPVVRCKDCKHHHYSVCEIPYCDRIDYGYGWKDEDFCSRGERKDGEHHDE